MVKHKFFLACVGVSILIAAGGCPRPDPEPDLSVSSSSVVLDGVDDTAIFDVSNTGESGSTLTFNVSADAPWVVFDHDSGESTGATDIDTFTVSVDESMVAKAVFEGTITISSNGGTETVDVTLNVEDTGEIIPDTNLMTETGLTAGGISTVATQKLTGTVPNPGGVDATTFEGSAFLVINGDKIPLSIQAATAKSGLVVEKEGETQWLDTADAVSDEELEALPKQGDTQFVFQVTFSINAGPNTLRIEVYDLEDSLFARTADWELTGAITPTSVVITLFWDTDQTDIDLHVNEYDEDDVDLGHVYYSARNVADMVLDFDDTNGFGPEHVTVDDVVGTKRFVIRVYYYADHNDSEQTTPTPVHVTAEVAGEQVLNESSSLSSESTASGWTTGAHVWEAGEVEASGANVYSVTLTEPDLSSWPTVSMQLIVVDEEDNPVDGLTDDEIFVINSGTKMEPVTVGSAKGDAVKIAATVPPGIDPSGPVLVADRVSASETWSDIAERIGRSAGSLPIPPGPRHRTARYPRVSPPSGWTIAVPPARPAALRTASGVGGAGSTAAFKSGCMSRGPSAPSTTARPRGQSAEAAATMTARSEPHPSFSADATARRAPSASGAVASARIERSSARTNDPSLSPPSLVGLAKAEARALPPKCHPNASREECEHSRFSRFGTPLAACQCASAQLRPQPTSTTSGTFRRIAPCISSFTSDSIGSFSLSGTSKTSSS